MVLFEQLTSVPARAMAVGAHPDDAELNAGGTLARWIAAGCEVTLVVCTDGDAGSRDGDTSREEVARSRRDEQEAAAKALGIREVVWLGFSDGGLEDSLSFRGRIVEMIRRYRPHTILTHDPYVRRRFAHRDHRIAGTVVQDAVFPFARDRLHFPEQVAAGLDPHKVMELLFWDGDEPDVILDVSGYVRKQAEALGRHRSQLGGLSCGPEPHDWLLERSRCVAIGESFEGGEVFRRLIAPG